MIVTRYMLCIPYTVEWIMTCRALTKQFDSLALGIQVRSSLQGLSGPQAHQSKNIRSIPCCHPAARVIQSPLLLAALVPRFRPPISINKVFLRVFRIEAGKNNGGEGSDDRNSEVHGQSSSLSQAIRVPRDPRSLPAF